MVLAAFLLLTQPGPGALERLAACRTVTADVERLACFDALAEALAPQIEAGDLVAVDRARIENVERRNFGLPDDGFGLLTLFSRSHPAIATAAPGGGTERRDEDGRLVALEAVPVSAARRLESGRLEVTLSNGQIWRQTDSTRVRTVSARHIEAGLTASITSGALGSFFLRLDGFAASFRAERVR